MSVSDTLRNEFAQLEVLSYRRQGWVQSVLEPTLMGKPLKRSIDPVEQII